MRGRVMWVLLVAAVVIVLLGGALLLFAPTPPVSFTCVGRLGGTSCTFGGMVSLTPAKVGGAVCSIVGLLLVAGVLGWVLGSRRTLPSGR